MDSFFGVLEVSTVLCVCGVAEKRGYPKALQPLRRVRFPFSPRPPVAPSLILCIDLEWVNPPRLLFTNQTSANFLVYFHPPKNPSATFVWPEIHIPGRCVPGHLESILQP